MKFQNPSMHSSEVILCIKKCNEWIQARTDTQISQKQYALPISLKLGA